MFFKTFIPVYAVGRARLIVRTNSTDAVFSCTIDLEGTQGSNDDEPFFFKTSAIRRDYSWYVCLSPVARLTMRTVAVATFVLSVPSLSFSITTTWLCHLIGILAHRIQLDVLYSYGRNRVRRTIVRSALSPHSRQPACSSPTEKTIIFPRRWLSLDNILLYVRLKFPLSHTP